MKPRVVDKLFSVITFIAAPVFFISISALIPCFFRNFYIWQIDLLEIPKISGFDKDTIIEAFNDVMNFIWKGAEFKTGSLAWTEAEKMHFADCIPLFWLQLYLVIGTLTYFGVYNLLIKTHVLRRVRFKGLSSVSYGGFLTLGLLIALGIFGAIDFNALFTLFHKIAFPGKENWVFNPRTEQIINILPETFFLSCAVFIIGFAVILSIISIVYGFVSRSKDPKIQMKKLS